jgi:hypothetical protein
MASHAPIPLDPKEISGDIPAPDIGSPRLKTLSAGDANRAYKGFSALSASCGGGNCKEQPLKSLVGISGSDLGHG